MWPRAIRSRTRSCCGPVPYPARATNDPVRLLLQLSADSNFSTLLLQEEVHTNEGSDYTVRAYIDGLAPDTQYFYRFRGKQ